MMNLKEQFIGALESIFLGMVMIWTITIAVALIHPEAARERTGVVEIYSLVAVSEPAGV